MHIIILCAITVAIAAQVARAQYSGVTTSCGSLTITGAELEANSTMFFTSVVNDVMSFEFRMISLDGKPLGWKELYDVDEDDDFLINYDCFVPSSTDNTACGNTYIAAGETIGNYQNRVLKIGFQKCDGWNSADFSTSVRLDHYYRPTTMLSVSVPLPVCGSLSSVVPTAFCPREGGVSAVSVAAAAMLLAIVGLTLAL
eukprot:GILI01023245.1.p1 GENE.GILI01023245.1~~GILI01023245.1.p1  ORF type:complete len:199 (-),score=33.84 GILI01023245.1:118-714(-)